MKLVSSECVILKHQDFAESDLLVMFLTRDKGRLKGIVKGSKKITGRGVGSFEPMTIGVMHYTEKNGSDLVNIRKCDPRPPYLFLQQDYRKLILAGYFADLMQITTIPAAEAERYHALLSAALARLCSDVSGRDLVLLRLGFELDFMHLQGLQFNWHACVQCGARIFQRSEGRLRLIRQEAHQADFSAGGIRCPDCRAAASGVMDVSPGTLAFLAAWRGNTGGDPDGAKAQPTRLAVRELEAVLTRHLVHQLERKPRSLALLPPVEEWLGA
jgi:DNA repair protein RecO (recombination protein O)